MTSITIVYILTAVISIVIAFFLSNLAKLTAQAKVKLAEGNRPLAATNTTPGPTRPLAQVINEQINQVIDSPANREEASKRLADVFNKELEKRIGSTTQELNKKYETLVKEERQNEEIAWKKYNKVLDDKKRTEAVIHSIAEGLVVVDAQGKVIMMNPAAEKLLGVGKKEKIGKPVVDSLKEEQLVSLVKSSEDKDSREIELVSQKDDTKKILRASSAVIENENGQTVGMVSVLSDITKQKELDRMKSNFVANVSHELRTPLVAMEKSISLILSKSAGEVTPTQEQFLTIAERNLKRLSLLINDLLDLSKLEANKIVLKLEPFSIEKVIDDSVDGLISWANSKTIKIEKKVASGLPQVQIDPNRFIQVLNNLIGNAIKFTPNNGNITIEALEGNGAEIEVSITDTGVGISKDDLPKVFDKFFQAGERVSTDISGTGIGLAIAKEIVELHGGKIWAESKKGSGAKFIFTLPLNSGRS